MGEKGRVISVDREYAVISLTRTEACAKCRACISGMSKEEMIIKAKNNCGAKYGDIAEIELQDGIFAKSVLIIYGIPFLMFLIGLGAGFLLSVIIGFEQYSELIAFIFAALFLLVSYIIIKKLDFFLKKDWYEPAIVSIISNDKLFSE